jgi:D-Tyr-tRNAtyr deacylase
VRAVIQTVTKAQVTVGENIVGEITSGLCIFLGVADTTLRRMPISCQRRSRIFASSKTKKAR